MKSKNEKPHMLAAAEEVDKISRSMLVWANTFPENPVDIIKYEFLSADQGDETGMALSTIQGTYITKRFILGGYQAEYQFKLIYRIKPGRSNDKRLEADELLNHFGDWARKIFLIWETRFGRSELSPPHNPPNFPLMKTAMKTTRF